MKLSLSKTMTSSFEAKPILSSISRAAGASEMPYGQYVSPLLGQSLRSLAA